MNCKPGDLAIVIRSDVPSDIGTIIEVLADSFVDEDGDHQWLTRWPQPTFGFNSWTGAQVSARDCYIPDAWLRPVSGLPITDNVTDEVTA